MRRLVFVVLASCYTPAPPTCTGGVIVLAESPGFDSWQIGSIDTTTGVATMLDGGGQEDPVLATSAGRHFLIMRTPGAISEIDQCGSGLDLPQFSAVTSGDGYVDPYDVAVASNGALWIPRYAVSSLLVLQTGSPPHVIDMISFDSDTKPEMSSVHVFGDHAFVTLQRLNPYPTSQQTSEIEVFDTDTLQPVTTITLIGRNPQMATEGGGKLWLAAAGNFSDAHETSAGIEVVDPDAMTSTLVVPETTLGASVTEIAVTTTCGAAITADPTPNVNATSLVTFTLDGSSVLQPVLSTPDFSLRGLLWLPDGRLLVGDKTNTGGNFYVHVFSVRSADCALTKITDWPMPSMPALAFAN